MNQQTINRVIADAMRDSAKLIAAGLGTADDARFIRTVADRIETSAPIEAPLVSVGPSGIGGPYQREIHESSSSRSSVAAGFSASSSGDMLGDAS